MISTFEIHVGELRATFLRNHNMRRHKDPNRRQPKRKTTQAQKTPATPTAATTATSTGALHPLRGGAPEQKRCIAYGSGAAPQQTRTNAELAQRTTHRRTPPCAAGPYRRQDGHATHATTCTPAHSDTSHTLTCEEPGNPDLVTTRPGSTVHSRRQRGRTSQATPSPSRSRSAL